MVYVVIAYIVMASIVTACTVMAYIVIVNIVMASVVMVYIVMDYMVMAYVVMVHIVMALPDERPSCRMMVFFDIDPAEACDTRPHHTEDHNYIGHDYVDLRHSAPPHSNRRVHCTPVGLCSLWPM